MIVKTKKYQLDAKTYKRIGLRGVLKKKWWIPVALFFGFIGLNLLINLFYFNTWIYFLAIIPPLFFYLIWWAQFTNAPNQQEMQIMFSRLNYEISGKEITMKKSAREGMQMKWEMIKKAEKSKDAFILIFSPAQFIHLPFRIFNSDNDIRFTEALLKRKNLLK